MDNEKLAQVVQLHGHAKQLLLLAEENEIEGYKDFLQPVLEQRSALDHIVRAFSVELNIITDQEPGYIKMNLDKACGHLYRAFFDVADWLSILLREKITKLMHPYSNECITSVAPEYYNTIVPNIEQLNQDIARIRNTKDIAAHGSIIQHVEEYTSIIQSILEDYKSLVPKISAFEAYKRKQRRKGIKNCVVQIIVGILLILLGALLNWLFSQNQP